MEPARQKEVTGACSQHAPRRAPAPLGGGPELFSNRPHRHRRQVLDHPAPHRGRGPAGAVPHLRGGEPASGRSNRAARARAPVPRSVGSGRGHRAAGGDRGARAPVRVPSVWGGAAGRAQRRPPASPVLGRGHRARPGDLEHRRPDTGRGACPGEPVAHRRPGSGRGLGVAPPVGQGGQGRPDLPGGPRAACRRQLAQGRGAGGNDAGCARALIDRGTVARDTSLPRGCHVARWPSPRRRWGSRPHHP